MSVEEVDSEDASSKRVNKLRASSNVPQNRQNFQKMTTQRQTLGLSSEDMNFLEASMREK